MDGFFRRHAAKAEVEGLPAPRQRRVIRSGTVNAHQDEEPTEETFGLPERKVEDQPERQGRFDRHVRIPPLPTPRPASGGSQPTMASGANQRVTSPRRRSARSYVGQFEIRYRVLYYG
jgi:hypothetical protein